MATVVITLKLMPTGPEVNLDKLFQKANSKIKSFLEEEQDCKKETEPIGFGLNALKILFTMDENKGSTEQLEAELKTIEGVESVEVTDVRRAIG